VAGKRSGGDLAKREGREGRSLEARLSSIICTVLQSMFQDKFMTAYFDPKISFPISFT